MNKNFQIQISFSQLIEQYIKRIEERNKDNKSIQEKSEKEKKISFTSIHPSQAYIFISLKILNWKSNSSKYSLSHIDQILDILLEWAHCVQLLFERAIFCTIILCWKRNQRKKRKYLTSIHHFSSLNFHIIQNLWLKIKFL